MRANNAKQNKNKTIFAWQPHHWLRNYNHPASLLSTGTNFVQVSWDASNAGALNIFETYFWSAPALDKFAPARALSFCGAVCSVALTSFGHVTSAQTVTLFSSVAILLPWEQFLSSSGALPLVQKLTALRRERFSVGRGPGLTTDVQPTSSYK